MVTRNRLMADAVTRSLKRSSPLSLERLESSMWASKVKVLGWLCSSKCGDSRISGTDSGKADILLGRTSIRLGLSGRLLTSESTTTVQRLQSGQETTQEPSLSDTMIFRQMAQKQCWQLSSLGFLMKGSYLLKQIEQSSSDAEVLPTTFFSMLGLAVWIRHSGIEFTSGLLMSAPSLYLYPVHTFFWFKRFITCSINV